LTIDFVNIFGIYDMYLQHYGLKRFPFDITSDPDFLWTGENHRQALELLREGVFENRGFVVLTGEVGTGKTTLINAFRRLDDIATIIVTIPDPDMEVLDFFNFLSHEFGIEESFANTEEFVHIFKSFLLRAYASYKKVLIIIDEAQRLNSTLLSEIAELAKIEMAGRRLLKIFFVGQLEFNHIMMAEENKGILDEVVAAESLKPLSEPDIRTYVNHRLTVAGCERDLFAPECYGSIYRSTRGLPRAVNVLCDRALLTGFLKKARSIDSDIIESSAEKIQLPSQRPPEPPVELPVAPELREPFQYVPVKKRSPRKVAGLVCLLLFFLVTAVLLSYRYVLGTDVPHRVFDILLGLAAKFISN
jgi:general secretion pathway protein A